ncbi:MAG TPA: hypothetical protein DFI00_07560 [Rhodospirillaceae bacterium]|nr:hypothetical protein [Alphaproteobacteria bacterium]OUT41534.1 MAG: hypothetical protein CBB62_04150 [Micavibrio sp. TMED2]HCI47135.1 hypothetical protein [Rhodospirillaceae bacterium]MAS46905.1 hypothetical protein [Alphaproteobacteria bacterium]MAX94999.1 hypothetical protein [Alphaproteobacteria bacterium]|tara:strand:- start:969 stop:1961 length:993 start_codon:yes stop_codon:yes gene_type:complete
MKLFKCPGCGGTIYFRNLGCSCGQAVAYDPALGGFVDLNTVNPCENREQIDCNWRADDGYAQCRSCRTTETIPDLTVSKNRELWAEAEQAKRWVMANLMRYGIFGPQDNHADPVFELISEATAGGEVQVMMGHAEGRIVINVVEADHAIRESRRQSLDERLRTMIGHFRHELGHYIHMRLVAVPGFAEEFRDLFGDEQQDYAAALERHYARQEPSERQHEFLTHYASAHPHEDWAETFAHFLHLVDIVDSAQASGLSWTTKDDNGNTILADFDPYDAATPEPLLSVAASLGIALNHVNRAMGLYDVYPFVMSAVTRRKLAFVHRWIKAAV